MTYLNKEEGMKKTKQKTISVLSFIVLSFLFPLSGCDSGGYTFGQQIEMGPFVFEVSGASEGVDYFSGSKKYKKIYVDLLLDTEKSTETNIKFDDFMNGKSKGNRMIIFPAMKIKDKSGTKFDGVDVKRVGGDTRWRADFWLIVHSRGTKSRLDYLDRTSSDFSLIIKNPERRKGQPNIVNIKL
jgi:hypothetical protein